MSLSLLNGKLGVLRPLAKHMAKAEASFARCFNVDSPDIIVQRIRGGRVDAYEALDKFVAWLKVNGAAPKTGISIDRFRQLKKCVESF